jgi:hypothetical protein
MRVGSTLSGIRESIRWSQLPLSLSTNLSIPQERYSQALCRVAFFGRIDW